MVMRICPNCKESFSCNEYDSDFVHVCNSGRDNLDKEDLLKTDVPNMNLQGMPNSAPLIARIVDHEHQHDTNIFGHDSDSYKERQHEEYITF